jgi:hypothetical protein
LLNVHGTTGEYIARLEEAGDLHGDNAIVTGHGVAVADGRSHSFVDGPTDFDEVLNLGEAAVDDLGAGGAWITIGAVDAGADYTNGEGDIALEDFGLIGWGEAEFSDFICHVDKLLLRGLFGYWVH